MAKVKGEVTVTISHRQSLTKYAIAGIVRFPNVQDKLSITPTSFLCSMSTHSTPAKNKLHHFATVTVPRKPWVHRQLKDKFKYLITEDCWDNDDASDTEPSEEPQHSIHHVGCRKSTSNSKKHSRHIRHQQHDSSAKPLKSQRISKCNFTECLNTG